MRYYPVYLNLRGHRVLVIGAGPVAWQKVSALLQSGASITVVAPDAHPEIEGWARQGKLEWRPRRYRTEDLKGARLVIAATDDKALQRRVAAEARARRVWVNVVDVTPLCDFIAPATVVRGDLQIAVSTGGGSPGLAKFVRRRLEQCIGPEYADLLALLQRLRPTLLAFPNEKRAAILNAALNEDFLELIKREGLQKAEQKLTKHLREAKRS